VNQNDGLFRPGDISFGMQRPAGGSKKERGFSGDFVRLLGRAILAVLLCFFIASQFFFWWISQERETLEQLRIVHESILSEGVGLRARRDKLMSKPRMAARAAAQLDLHFPKRGQEHNLY
jgi:hypothetical protein